MKWDEPLTTGQMAAVLGMLVLLELAACLGLLWGLQ